MRIFGIDPSFSSTGLSMIDTKNKTIEFYRFKAKIGEKTFQNTYKVAYNHCRSLRLLFKEIGVPDYVISEEPFHGGDFSTGLYQLDSMLFMTIMTTAGIKELWNMSPTYLRHLQGVGYSKSDSVKTAKSFLEVFKKHGFKNNQTRINSDEAESFIYSSLLYTRKFPNNKITYEISQLNSKIMSNKEKLLYSNSKEKK